MLELKIENCIIKFHKQLNKHIKFITMNTICDLYIQITQDVIGNL